MEHSRQIFLPTYIQVQRELQLLPEDKAIVPNTNLGVKAAVRLATRSGMPHARCPWLWCDVHQSTFASHEAPGMGTLARGPQH